MDDLRIAQLNGLTDDDFDRLIAYVTRLRKRTRRGVVAPVPHAVM